MWKFLIKSNQLHIYFLYKKHPIIQNELYFYDNNIVTNTSSFIILRFITVDL